MKNLSDILRKGNRAVIENLLISMIPASLQEKIVTKYEAKVNNGQSTLFGTDEAETTFQDSPLFNLNVFLAKFEQETQLGIDVEDYYRDLLIWTEGKGRRQKRTAKGWVATVHGFMRRDKKGKKLRMKKTDDMDNLFKEYLST